MRVTTYSPRMRDIELNDIQDGYYRLKAELYDPTRIEINKRVLEAIIVKSHFQIPDGSDPDYPKWDPKQGEKAGEIFGIPVYIDNTIDGFVILAAVRTK